MKMFKILTMCAIILLAHNKSKAQTTFTISGIVTDSISRQPIKAATVAVKSLTDKSVKIVLSDENGRFSINDLQGDYRLGSQMQGYQSKTIVIETIDAKSGRIEVGLQLAPEGKTLNTVEISAAKHLVRQEADRLVYDVKADPDSKGSSVLDMMRKVPFVSLDADQNILLKNNTGFKIFLNGKPSGMIEQNPKDVLRSMPAATIEKIEVITNPPAKYDAEGFAGIINIVTSKKTADGYNGTVNLNGSTPTGGPGVGSSFNFKAGKLLVAATAGGSINKTPETESSLIRTSFGSDATDLTQTSQRKFDGRSGYFGTELSYEINKFQLLSAQFNISGTGNNNATIQQSLLNGSGGVLQGYHLQNNYKGDGHGLDASLNYQVAFQSKKIKLLTFSYRYTDYVNVNDNVVTLTNRTNYTLPDFYQYNKAGTNEHTLQLDYASGTKALGFEHGVKAILRGNSSNFSYTGANALSNSFNMSQDVFSAFSSLTYAGKKWGVKAGLRAEKTVVGGDVAQNYLNVVPSVSASYQVNDANSLNFGFSQRLRRPGVNRINPYVDRSNPNYEMQGNADLRPAIINNIMAGYNLSGRILSVTLGTTYSYFNDLDFRLITYNAATGVTSSTYENIGRGDALSIDLSANLAATKKLSLSFNGNLTYVNIQAAAAQIETKGWYHNFTVSGSYHPTASWRIGAYMNVIGKNFAPQSFQSLIAPQINTSFSSTHELIKGKWSITATVNNPFKKFRNVETRVTGMDFYEVANNQTFLRVYKLSLNYNFGELKDAVKRTKVGIRNDDVVN
ncbi:outer membrane beta-barrel family protein [Mucilaginibacter auburnensis]|uniref:Outer membrane receptor protein involved in Fe transport n=1 Tax=Mucilaginibacter auburnensis TaxID=1457233 RepID=A0A2H9VM09_9SPHI|nr:outer membrane beta-barrel family protein [Mucilaginibacter auburnensis]PJJ79343.1 outer membrane receptor protein involved in Fe transport [Mucilaginibacter auburnensis]